VAAGSTSAAPRSPWTIVVDKVDLNQLMDIDCKNHCYMAYVYVELLVLNAAGDEAMAAPGIVPPKPPLMPNAGWYLDRLTPINAKDVEVVDMSVRRQGEHLLMLKAWRGTFDIHVEMENFPFDGCAAPRSGRGDLRPMPGMPTTTHSLWLVSRASL
jgi:hypothetical protein